MTDDGDLVIDLAGLPEPVRNLARWFDPSKTAANPVLAPVMGPFAELAAMMITQYPPDGEMAAGLRKMLEARECFVRAAVAGNTGSGLVRATQIPGPG